jgi:hypothetical protein
MNSEEASFPVFSSVAIPFLIALAGTSTSNFIYCTAQDIVVICGAVIVVS